MLAYHFYTLSKPVSPDSVPVVNGVQRYYNYRAKQATHAIFFEPFHPNSQIFTYP